MPLRTKQTGRRDNPLNRAATPHSRQRGAIAVFVAIFLATLLAVGAFAIDIANLIMVKGELQNAADAAAQAGAQCLYPRTGDTNCVANGPRPDFVAAESAAAKAATQADKRNAVQGALVTDIVATGGYWNLAGTPNTLQLPPMTPKTDDYPGLQVIVSKEGVKNGGAVAFYLAKVMAMFDTKGSAAMGLDSADISATAVSVVTPPGSVSPGGLFPFAMAKCMYDTFWASGQPILFKTGDKDLNGLQQTVGEPWLFRLGNTSKTPFLKPDGVACDAGQWTPFADSKAGASVIDSYIPPVQKNQTQALSPQLALEDKVYIRTGTTDSLYQDTQACSLAGDKRCGYATMVVTAEAKDGTISPIKAFGCIKILCANSGGNKETCGLKVDPVTGLTIKNTDKFLEVQMSNSCPPYSGGGIGPDDGVHNPPKLAF